jgi:glycosyltransferase involved in cell wall biosynthesis
MNIAFTTRGLSFDGASLDEPLGGSETALLCVARELAKLGHRVTVFCECRNPGLYDGVHYQSNQIFQDQMAIYPLDVHISSRWPDFLASRVEAGLRVLWCHDTVPDVPDKSWMQPLFQTDMLMLLSDYHIANYLEKVPELENVIWKTSNGVDLEMIESCLAPKVPGKLIYTSRPDRGLLFLLRDIFPKIREVFPEVRLYHCAYELSGNMKVPPEVEALYEEVQRLSETTPNVVNMGSLDKKQLYRHISSSELLLYPTHFPEISCITAMEAQACGTPMVTTNAFALKETVGAGCLIGGLPTDPEYVSNFVDKVCDLLADGDKRKVISEAGKAFVRSKGYTWEAVARSWASQFQNRLEARASSNLPKILKNLVRKNDLMVATIGSRKCDHPIDAEVCINRVVEWSDLTKNFKAAINGQFARAAELLSLYGARPVRVLDYRTPSISAGLAFSRWIPGSEVTIAFDDETIGDQLNKMVASGSYENVQVVPVHQVADTKFDLVLLNEVVDNESSPNDFVNSVVSKFLNEDGVLLSITRLGTDRVKADNSAATRRWNFDICDLQHMHEDCRDFRATFSTVGTSRKVHCNAAGEIQGHWVTAFRNGGGSVKKPKIWDKILRTRPYQSVAVCMIAGNEEDWIGGSLKSTSAVADEVHVLLNGSTDSTESICEQNGAKVRKADFDTFSQVRNLSKETATADWILWIDADERMVSPGVIKRYLDGQIFHGFAIRQNHLMLDMNKSFDLPIRLFRNRPEYQFVGCIHEHCEDTSKGPYDVAISPAMPIPDTDIVHYGYLNEKVRRYKCSARNIGLLIRDVVENGFCGRQLTWVLVIRDYLNMVKWAFERDQTNIVRHGSQEHKFLNAAISTFVNRFEGTAHRYEQLAFPMYQEALEMLGKSGIPFDTVKHPPFEIGMSLFGSVGGIEDKDIKPQTRWFRDFAEYEEFSSEQFAGLAKGIGVATEVGVTRRTKQFYEEPDHVSLLGIGVNQDFNLK